MKLHSKIFHLLVLNIHEIFVQQKNAYDRNSCSSSKRVSSRATGLAGRGFVPSSFCPTTSISNKVRRQRCVKKPDGGEVLPTPGGVPDFAEKYDESSPPELTVSSSGVGVGRPVRGELLLGRKAEECCTGDAPRRGIVDV